MNPRAAKTLRSTPHPYGAFFATILTPDKCQTDGCSVFDLKKDSGLGRIRTGDLRDVKTGNLALRTASSDWLAPFSVVAPETTTRNASPIVNRLIDTRPQSCKL
ncbi:MAG: hypothetical protein WAN56_02775 [Halobacteriota archaeon]